MEKNTQHIQNSDIFEENTICYGKNAVAELLKSGDGVDTVYVSDTMSQAQVSYYTALAKQAGAVVKRVHQTKLKNMCKSENHQGVAAYGACVTYAQLSDVLETARQNGEPPFLLLSDGIEDPHNLGAIIRTAFLCKAHAVVIPKRGAVGITPVVIKSSAGAALRLPVVRQANIAEVIRKIKQENIFVYCADMDGQPVYKQNLTGPIALVVGSEGKGVSRLVKSLCDASVSLPMASTNTGIDSFNVSVATGIITYEIMKQRGI